MSENSKTDNDICYVYFSPPRDVFRYLRPMLCLKLGLKSNYAEVDVEVNFPSIPTFPLPFNQINESLSNTFEINE